MAKDGLYIQMFSLHGLVRFDNPELGRDADTGGQVLYVVELAKYLCERDDVRRVDLFTRLIGDPRVSDDYSRPEENLNDKCRLVRIQCGGRKYFRKELIWPYLDEYVDKTIKYINRQNEYPDVVHGHYADAGYVAMNLAHIFGIPFVFTGHSMGIPKKQKLLNDGMSETDIIKKYKIDNRIGAEERILKSADLVVTSTNQEIEEQYKHYMNADFPEYKVIPPGIDIERFYPFYHDRLPDEEKPEVEKYAQANLYKQLDRFFIYPDKPMILALSRPDKRKNISGLIKAYGEDKELQAMANLAIFAGIRKEIDKMEENEKDVLTRMLLEMDRYDLYGKLAIPKKHDVEYEVPELYRIAAEKHGVFVNPALTEPFGLTLLEAAATGIPLVATNDGGPRDIIGYCENGILIDPNNTQEIADAIKKILTDEELWETYSRNGIMNVRKFYTWQSHAETYVKSVSPLAEELNMTEIKKPVASTPMGRRLTKVNRVLVVNMDCISIESDANLDPLINWVGNNQKSVVFAVATGRSIDSISADLEGKGLEPPDIIISSTGTEIYYGSEHQYDSGWEAHISNRWEPDKIRALLDRFDFLDLQEKSAQSRFKISYSMEPKRDRISEIHDILSGNKCRYTLIYSGDRHLDILPYRASKGKAIRYISYKWEIPLSNFLVCGGSETDDDMLRGEPRGVIVGDGSDRLRKKLKGAKHVYLAKKPSIEGLLEGIERYRFPEKQSRD